LDDKSVSGIALARAARWWTGGLVGIATVDAARLMATNRDRHEELEDRHTALTARSERERAAQDERRREVYDEVLVPFRGSFCRLRNLDLAELAAVAMPTCAELPVGDHEIPTLEGSAIT
jgi:hypothetical protein